MKQAKIKASDDDYEDFKAEKYKTSYVPENVGTFVIDILSEIESPEQFSDAIRVLELADENNNVQINLQCPGGNLDAVDRFLHAMKKCEGRIHTVATGGVHSAATFILLESDSFELSDNFYALLHCGSLGNIGSFNQYASKAEFDVKKMQAVLRNMYTDFLSEEEFAQLVRGGDLWLDANQWCERFESREAIRSARRCELQYDPKDVAFKPAPKKAKK